MQRRANVWILLAAGSCFLAGCDDSAKNQVKVQPPAPAPIPVAASANVTQPIPVPAPATAALDDDSLRLPAGP